MRDRKIAVFSVVRAVIITTRAQEEKYVSNRKTEKDFTYEKELMALSK